MKKLYFFILIIPLGLIATFVDPVKDRVVTFTLLEYISMLDDWMTTPDSRFFGVIDNIDGREIQQPAETTHPELDEWISKSSTQALIVKRGGKILHESYSPEAQGGLNINAQSMSKTITVLLIGIAIQEGKVQSEEESILTYLPEIPNSEHNNVRIKDLIQQVSGMHDDNEDVLTTLAGNSIEAKLNELEFKEDKEFKYSNVNYYLLGLILQRVYEKPLNQLIAEKIWLPLELENAKVINTTGYCCIFATAQSWLRIGELILNKGMFKNQQIVSSQWIEKMITDIQEPDLFLVQATSRSTGNSYGYHIYGGLEEFPNYYWSEGMGLQLLMIEPESKTIIVRLGDVPTVFKFGSNRWDDNLVSELLRTVEHL